MGAREGFRRKKPMNAALWTAEQLADVELNPRELRRNPKRGAHSFLLLDLLVNTLFYRPHDG